MQAQKTCAQFYATCSHLKPPGLVTAFMTSTRARLYQRSGSGTDLKHPFSDAGDAPAPQLLASLARARMLYGSGLGFASLKPLAAVVRCTIGHRWDPEGQAADALVMADADIAAGLQSCKEELQGGVAVDYTAGRAALDDLAAALVASRRDVDGWGGEFPFERALSSVQDFRL
ncbi:hypothetical protein MVEN_02293400 [Mycena venus]|uniref:Uncharacterized protein n=1 Tax=Mycena venus TaxID=2733690 RepID=A0A8H7CET6_9AGAR|nr:hypothetical protein MVEN_02293400 [Mycena venus]